LKQFGSLTQFKWTAQNSSYDTLIKIVMCGDEGSGKGSVLLRYAYDYYDGQSISSDFVTKSVVLNNKIVKVQLWDTGREERTVTSRYYKGVNAGIIVFDISSEGSPIQNIARWVNEIKKQANESLPVLILANKYDTDDKKKELIFEDVKKNFPHYIVQKVSAKTGKNLNEAISHLLDLALPYTPVTNDKLKLIPEKKYPGRGTVSAPLSTSSNSKPFPNTSTPSAPISTSTSTPKLDEKKTHLPPPQKENPALVPTIGYAGNLSRKDAEDLLKDKEIGAFLIRFSDQKSGYVMSYKNHSGKLSHMGPITIDTTLNQISVETDQGTENFLSFDVFIEKMQKYKKISNPVAIDQKLYERSQI